MKLTNIEKNVLSPYLDRLYEDDLEAILGQFRQLAHLARERRQRGETARMPAPGDAEWNEWLGDLHFVGVLKARGRDPGIPDDAARAYACVYRDATAAIRQLYLPAGDRCPALEQLDRLECAEDPNHSVPF